MSNKSQEKGISKEEMTVKELKELAISLQIATADEVKAMEKPELLETIGAWEEAEIARRDAGNPEGVRTLGTKAQDLVDNDVDNENEFIDNGYIDLGLHKGKKIVSIKPVEVNGKEYNEIVTEDGVTFTEPK